MSNNLKTDFDTFMWGYWGGYVKQAAEQLIYLRKGIMDPWPSKEFCAGHVDRPVSRKSGQCAMHGNIQMGPYRFCAKHALIVLKKAAKLAETELKTKKS